MVETGRKSLLVFTGGHTCLEVGGLDLLLNTLLLMFPLIYDFVCAGWNT